MDSLLTNLADYSRQLLQVGTPPLNIYTATGARPSDSIIQLSLLARIADALEGRGQLPTAVLTIQPKYADLFRNLVADVFAERAGDVCIKDWRLQDEHTVHVTLAYERGHSLFFISRYWQRIMDEQAVERSQHHG